jgi:hypothetical protein
MVSLQVQDRDLPLLVLGGVHPPRLQDGWSSPTWKQVEGGWNVECRSTQWKSARVELREVGKAWEIGLTVTGKGTIDIISFLEGALAERVPHPENTMTMVRHNRMPPRHYGRATPVWYKRIFNPQPESRSGPWLDPLDPTRITAAGTFGPDIYDTYFSPGIWCYVLDLGEGRGVLSLGLVAEPGTEHFHTFGYRGGTHFGLTLEYDGKLAVDGEFSSPRLRIAWTQDADSALVDYVQYLRDSKRVVSTAGKTIPAWWRKPSFCGWGSQVAWARLASEKKLTMFDQGPVETSAGGYGTQAVYEKMISLLDEHRLPYGTLIIDWGWSQSMCMPVIDKDKWPDLPGFIRREHEKGKKVLLWLGCWNAAKLPKEYLMDCDNGLKAAVDPMRPAFRDDLKKAIAYLIGPDVDADGFKIDFTGDVPRGAGYRPYGPLWGMEMLLDYVRLIHNSLKAAKPDAMMMTHCGNPHFSDITDVLRLNDLFFDKLDIRDEMAFRARMAKIACPEWPIDCDGDPFNSPESWLQYHLFQPEIGTPSMYDLTNTSGSTAPIPREYVAQVREVWEKYLRDNKLD